MAVIKQGITWFLARTFDVRDDIDMAKMLVRKEPQDALVRVVKAREQIALMEKYLCERIKGDSDSGIVEMPAD